jgi:hypothetical protein
MMGVVVQQQQLHQTVIGISSGAKHVPKCIDELLFQNCSKRLNG